MEQKILPDNSLTDANDSMLIVIDVQQAFLNKLNPEQCEPIVNRITWITQMASRFEIPVIATAEYIEFNGGTVPQVAEKFPKTTKDYNKMSFGLAGDQNILSAVRDTGRKTAVLVGFETDVCVCQSALGLMQNGYRVVALADAVASPGPSHEFGIERMRNAGVIISTVKGTFYEWLRTVNRVKEEFKDIYIKEQPMGVSL